jgi:Barstar (barnase inhibitor)
MPIVNVPTDRINDWPTFHQVFADVLGFPEWYGRNGDAWIDCVTSADDQQARMVRTTVGEGDVLTLQLDDVNSFSECCPEQYLGLIEMAAFVNWRRIEIGLRPIVALSFYKRRPSYSDVAFGP